MTESLGLKNINKIKGDSISEQTIGTAKKTDAVQKNADLISVIVPIYNVQQYLPECLDSLLVQTYTNLEILLIDDGSTDESGKICDEYAAKDDRVRVIHKENGDVSAARNTGLTESKGKYISFVDSDDVVSPLFLEELYDLLQKKDADISACAFERSINTIFSEKRAETKDWLFSSEEMLVNWHGKFKAYETVLWNKLYKAELFNDLRFADGRRNEDVLLSHRIVEKAKNVAITNKILYLYRVRPNSITTSEVNRKYIQHNLSAQQERLAYFKEHGYRKAYLQLLKGYVLHKVWLTVKHI